MVAPSTAEEFTTLLADAQSSVVHLELRDQYMTSDPGFTAWKASGGGPVEADPDDDWWRDLISSAVARGIRVRRARIVSEPVTDYVRWEYEATAATNIAAGEEVRWLPRRRASDIALPGNDFWLFDSSVVLWNHFTGAGEWVGREVTHDPVAAKLCAAAFDVVWERAIDHGDYRPV